MRPRPLVLEVREPAERAHERRSAAERRPGPVDAVDGAAEADLLRGMLHPGLGGRDRRGRARGLGSVELDLGGELVSDAADRAQELVVAERLPSEAREPLERALVDDDVWPQSRED